MKPIALQMYTLRERAENDLPDTLRKVADLGYVGVETAGLYDRKAPEFRRMLDDVGLVACAAHGPFPDPQRVAEIVETAGVLGYKHYVIPWIGPRRYTSPDEIRRLGAVLQATAELLAAQGIRLSYHNHDHEMKRVEGELALARLLDAAPALSAEIDAYWASDFGQLDAPAFIRRYAARAPLLHVKDGPFDRATRLHTAIGAGRMDIPAVIAAADPNVLEWIIVELDRCATDMFAAVADSYRYLTSRGLAKGRK